MSAETVQRVLKEHSGELMSLPGVLGTGQGLCEGRPCVKVFVLEKTQELERKIPHVLGGCPVEIVETGEIRPLD